MNFRRCLDGSLSGERVQGDWFSMAGFLGLTVLSGGSGEGHSSGRARRGEAAPLAVLRQSLSGVQRGHSGTHKGWHNP